MENGAFAVGDVSYKIGTWQFGGQASEVNRPVAGHGGRASRCSLNLCLGGLQLDDVLTLQLAVVPGQTFHLGFQLVTSTLAIDPTEVSIRGAADLALSAGPGHFITGTNGYDSRVSAVPEPGAWALLLAGIAVVSLRTRATCA